MTNLRKTVAVSSAPPKHLANSFTVWRRASAPFALLWRVYRLLARNVIRLLPRSPDCKQAIDRLREEVARLPAPAVSADPWSRHRVQLRHDILTKDPRAFFAWDVIAETMCPPPYARFIRVEKQYLKAHDWSIWSRVVRTFPKSNAIHQAYHVARFQNAARVAIRDFDFILEFGGGYGEMRRVIHELGFAGHYVIVDLPEATALQQYYLGGRGAEFQSATSQPVEVLGTRKLFIATWSFDETPLELRAPWMELLTDFDAFLVAYQLNFAGIDNQAFFSDWQQRFPRIRWTTHVISQLKDSLYLFGTASD